MFNRERRVHETERLNLVPIMDAVFIFIFFLLFSAQFIKIYEIETDAPLVSEVPQQEDKKKDPLNLTIKVLEDRIVLITGLNQVEDSVFYNLNGRYVMKAGGKSVDLKERLISLRQSHPDDDYAIMAPLAGIRYQEIVKILDIAQTIPKNTKLQVKKDGKNVLLSKIFRQIVLEPISVGDE